MDREQLKALWLREQSIAHVHGWDFSHLKGRYTEEDDLPWDYRELVLSQLQPSLRLLDMETGGGEFLLSLGHLHQNTAATEGYAPNAALCRERLLPLGIDFREAQGEGALPFEAASFDLVINRHGAYSASEVLRVLKPGGLFITQQVGAENDRELVELLLPGSVPLPFPQQYLETKKKELAALGFEILAGEEAFRPIAFYDVGRWSGSPASSSGNSSAFRSRPRWEGCIWRSRSSSARERSRAASTAFISWRGSGNSKRYSFPIASFF